MALREADSKNFNTLVDAVENRDLILLECSDKETGKYVAVIAAMNWDPDTETYTITPLAKMFEGNPFKEVLPPPDEGE